MCSSSRSQMFFKIDVLKISEIFTGKHLCYSPFFTKFKTFRPATLSVVRSCFSKYMFLKSCNIHSKTPMLECRFNKVAGLQEETPTQVFSSECCEIFKDGFFIEHLR